MQPTISNKNPKSKQNGNNVDFEGVLCKLL